MEMQSARGGSAAASGERIDPCHFAFRVDDGPDPGWWVQRFHLAEGLSQPYELTADLTTTELSTNPDELLGASCEFEVERGDRLRTIFGIIHRVDYIGVSGDKLHIRVYAVPALRLLQQRIDTRIFQGMTVPEVLEAVLGPALEEYGREVEMSERLKGEYPKLDYCVQYREPDAEFAFRLMEEAGITYHFEHDDQGRFERLILIDNNNDYPEVDVDDEIPVIPHRQDEALRQSIQFLDWCSSERISAVKSSAWNWKATDSNPEGEKEAEPPRGKIRESYDHGDRRHIVDDIDDDGFDGTTDQRGPMAVRRLEMFRYDQKRGQGRSNVTGFAAGGKFAVGEHSHPDVDGKRFVLTRVIHSGEQPEDAKSSGTVSGIERYSNTFECIPEDTPFRPPMVTPKPRVHGPETAVVTGPEGEEIHTDKYGRIKVQFHWDRLNAKDETSSCWVRVQQTWSGPGWGTWFIPRIGMEVVVGFLQGNPDRPLVTGCVYNGTNDLPYPLPDEKTKSTMKSNSSPGGDGFNEFRFEDAAGNEEIYLHAQKDFNEKVLNDHTSSVDMNETITIGGDRKMNITGNHIVSVSGQPPEAASANGGGGGGGGGFKGSSTDVTGDYKVTASATAYMSAPDSITLECPGSSIKLEPGKITMKAGGGATVVLDANALMQAAGGGKVFLDGNALVQSAAGSRCFLDGNALLKSSGGSKVLLDGNALVQAASGGSGFYDANAEICGAKATVISKSGGFVELTANADLVGATTTCAGKGASVTLTGGSADIAGPAVNITGDGTVAVTAGTVSLN